MKKTKIAVLLVICILAAALLPHAALAAEAELSLTVTRPTGDRVDIQKPDNYHQVSQDEIDTMDRAMRAFLPSEDSLVRNGAAEFYYYSQLEGEEQSLYDALMTLTEHPEAEDNYSMLMTLQDPSSDEFMEAVYVAYLAMTFDHPELFWLYNSSETSIQWSSAELAEGSGFYSVFFQLTEPYTNYEEEMTAFNAAADAFLADIDMSLSQREIVTQIHDKLIDLVTYDMAVLENSAASGGNLAHTAYGALVQNSEGVANYAVCDGYSLAFEYLLQQAGIGCAFVGGAAGDTDDTVGGHAWNVIQLDGQWYEVDTTWDDPGSIDEAVESLPADSLEYKYFSQAIHDEDYRDTITHYLCGVSTEEIRSFEPNDSHYYYIEDLDVSITVLFPSVHIRDCDLMPLTPMGSISGLTPTADGDLF